jgi:hypothetical protein
MKKTPFILLLLFCSAFSALAQTEKGTWMLGGSAGWSKSSSDYEFGTGSGKYKNSSLSFSPNIGYFVSDNFALGLSLPIQFFKTEVTGEPLMMNDSRYFSYGFGPSIRYYFPLNEKWALLSTAAYNLGWAISDTQYFDGVSGMVVDNKSKNDWSGFAVGAGVSYFINKNIGLEGLLQYQGTKHYENDTDDRLTFKVGFQIYLGK